MAGNSPATRIAVIGAGPIGLEAALYARSAGMDVVVMDARDIASNVAAWGFVGMFTPWAMNTTPLGRQAVGDDPLLSSDECSTGAEFIDRYLLPLSQCEALANCIDTGIRVTAVGRDSLDVAPDANGELSASGQSGPFRLSVVDKFGVEQMDHADIVLDCSGTYSNPRYAGPGGVPAPGEVEMKRTIWYTVPDVAGKHRASFAGRHTLLIGTGTSAATILINLSHLAATVPGTKVTWAFHKWGQVLRLVEGDPLPARRALAEQVLRLPMNPPAWLELIEDARVDSLSAVEGKSATLRQGDKTLHRRVDEIVAAVGYRPDETLFGPLGGRPNYASSDQTRVAVEGAATAHPDADPESTPHVGAVVTAAPGYYLLGAKSYGLNRGFLLRVGHWQIHNVFQQILGAHHRPTELAGASELVRAWGD